MKRILALLIFAACLAVPAHAQNACPAAPVPPCVTNCAICLQWTNTNPGTIAIYRAPGACPASGTTGLAWQSQTATAPAQGPWIDKGVLPGVLYAYVLIPVVNGVQQNASEGPCINVQMPGVAAGPVSAVSAVLIAG